MSTTEPLYTWKCKCGQFKVNIHGEPLFCFNCQCHGCVAAMRFINEQHPGGTSADCEGGVGKAMIALKDIQFVDEANPCEKLGYVKVGENGKNIRSYTKCCGTQLHTSGGEVFPCNFRPFNRNALYRASDGSPYDPPNKPVMNIHAKNAFDPKNVPDPKCDEVPFWLIFAFMKGMLMAKLGFGENETLKGKKSFYCKAAETDIEVCPITWEE